MILIMSRFNYQLTIGGDNKDEKPEESGCIGSIGAILASVAIGGIAAGGIAVATKKYA